MARKLGGWAALLSQPVVTPDGKRLVTLADARAFVLALPEASGTRRVADSDQTVNRNGRAQRRRQRRDHTGSDRALPASAG